MFIPVWVIVVAIGLYVAALYENHKKDKSISAIKANHAAIIQKYEDKLDALQGELFDAKDNSGIHRDLLIQSERHGAETSRLNMKNWKLEKQVKALLSDGSPTAYGLLKHRYEQLAETVEILREQLKAK